MEIFPETDFFDAMNAIKQADLKDVDRLVRAFDMITRRVIAHCEQDVELARAVQDADWLVKNQIKLEMMKSARRIFEDCYRFMIGGSAWNDQQCG
jgi:hypothetical protein